MNRATKVVRVRERKILDLREVRFWSQEDLATAAGVEVRAVQRVETARLARYDIVVAVAKALKVEPEVIFEPVLATAGEETAAPTATAPPPPLPDLVPDPPSTHTAHRLVTGDALGDLLSASDLVSAESPRVGNAADKRRLRTLVQEIRDLAFVWHDLEDHQRASETKRYSSVMAELARSGYGLFANQRRVAWASHDGRFRTQLELGTLLVRRLEFREGAPIAEVLFQDGNEGGKVTPD